MCKRSMEGTCSGFDLEEQNRENYIIPCAVPSLPSKPNHSNAQFLSTAIGSHCNHHVGGCSAAGRREFPKKGFACSSRSSGVLGPDVEM